MIKLPVNFGMRRLYNVSINTKPVVIRSKGPSVLINFFVDVDTKVRYLERLVYLKF